MKSVKDLEYYLSLPYTIEVVPDEEGGYVAKVKELEGCITQADSWAELEEMIKDAIRSWIETAIEEGIPVPEKQKV